MPDEEGIGPFPLGHDDGYRAEEWLDVEKRRHRLDGPAYVSYFSNGGVRSEFFRMHGLRHRLDGPAERVFYDSGSPRIEKWFREDVPHRVDGPAVTSWNPDGSVARESYRLRGDSNLWSLADLAFELEGLDADELDAEYRLTPYVALLDEGAAATDVLEVFAQGVTTVEGIRAVFAGAPVEWARAFESGQAIGSVGVSR